MTRPRKHIEFRGTSLADLRGFPKEAQHDMGQELELVQKGADPSDWKPMNIVGPGVKEVRVRDSGNIYRSLYVTNVGDKIYVLHCFQKKTQKTSQRDIDLGCSRLTELVKEQKAQQAKPRRAKRDQK